MHFAVADRRNALGRMAHRKSLMQGLLSVAGGREKPPSSELKQGKRLPEHLATTDEEYLFPACANKPLKDPDDYYQNKVGWAWCYNSESFKRMLRSITYVLIWKKCATIRIKLIIVNFSSNFIAFLCRQPVPSAAMSLEMSDIVLMGSEPNACELLLRALPQQALAEVEFFEMILWHTSAIQARFRFYAVSSQCKMKT